MFLPRACVMGQSQTWLSTFLLLCCAAWCPAYSQQLGQQQQQQQYDDGLQGESPWVGGDEEWGSGGLQDLLLSGFPADSPFVSEDSLGEQDGGPVNCTQRFWLPAPPSSSCGLGWGDLLVGEQEFEEVRLLVLQNRASLRAVSQQSGLEEAGAEPYGEQARRDVQGVRSDHLELVQTAETMEQVFFSLEEKRREANQPYVFSSMKEQLMSSKASLQSREQLAGSLEEKLSALQRSLESMQHRLATLMARRW